MAGEDNQRYRCSTSVIRFCATRREAVSMSHTRRQTYDVTGSSLRHRPGCVKGGYPWGMKEQKNLKNVIRRFRPAGTWLLVAFALAVAASRSYLLFHTLVEGFSIVIAIAVHILATRTFKHSKNAFLLYLGTAYLFVAIIDVAHTMTYYGMNVFLGYGPNTPTQLWIAGRFVEAVSLFLAAMLASRPIPRSALLGAYGMTTSILLVSIMWLKVFPVCFIEGQGLTAFKVAGEYAISILIVGAILQLRSRRDQLGRSLYRVMVASMAVNIVAELSFTLYTDVYGIMNFVGHMARLVAFYLIYRGVVIPGIDASYNAVTTELKTNAVSDYLTGLYNRRGLVELARQAMGEAGDEPSAVGVLLMDLDQFKIVNDLYGHLTGDRVLRDFAALLRSSVEGTDLACRLGGDEFVAFLGDASGERMRVMSERIREAVGKWAASDEVVRSLGVSIGSALWEPGSPGDIETLLKVADERMYQEKQAKKARA